MLSQPLLRDREGTRRNEVERDVLPGRAVREIKMVERLQLFFQKTSTALFSIGKANNAPICVYIFCDSSLWTHRRGATSVGTRSLSTSALPSLRRLRFAANVSFATSLLAEARDLSGNKDVANGEVGRSSRGSSSFHDSLRLRLSPRFEVNRVIHESIV